MEAARIEETETASAKGGLRKQRRYASFAIMLAIRFLFLPVTVSFALAACSAGNERKISASEIVDEYEGVGYSGVGLNPHPIKMSIRMDGTFTGDVAIPDAYVRHTGTWNFGKYPASEQCQEIELKSGGTLLGVKCASVGPDGLTGFDCIENQECTMKRKPPTH